MYNPEDRLVLGPGNGLVAELKRIAAAEAERILSIARAERIDNEQDAGFDVCQDCGGPLDRLRVRYCDQCREHFENRAQLEEEQRDDDADRMIDRQIESGLS